MEQSTTTKAEKNQEEWKTVSFTKGRQQGARGNQKHNNTNPIKNANGPGISVKLFNANTGLDHHSSRQSVPNPTGYGRHEVGHEQLPQPGLAQQYPSTPSTLNEPSASACNEKPMELTTTLQPNLPIECSPGHAFLHARDINPTQSHIPAMGTTSASPGATSSTTSSTTSIPTLPPSPGTSTSRSRNGGGRGTPQSTLRKSPRNLKSRRSKSVYLHGEAREEARAQLPTSIIQMLDGHKTTSGSNSGQQSHDPSFINEKEPSPRGSEGEWGSGKLES
ncbi:PREDICTED: putative protein TPRXL [Nicotiana attenuata]|uniref:putative protein TPRXL n=1 Tax=Nicotiana attenuata TaxID=49451 RepID=UPI0009047595|nr:PREDICTED: putative protein TPRXL [Nicotiana attenuata]